MRTITTPDGNLTEAFLEDSEYTVMFDKSLQEGRVMEMIEGSPCVQFTFSATSIEDAVESFEQLWEVE